MTTTFPRRLIWFPILHTQADLGTMAKTVRQLQIRKIGRLRWERHCSAINESWAGIRRYIEDLNLPWARVRLYQDGLANCGRERDIVQSLARAGSLNHQLLLDLIDRGATLVGTESPELLLEEYELAGQQLSSMSAGRPDADRRRQQQSQSLLERRDGYIVERIDRTLAAGETGLLFLGKLHALAGLPRDMELLRQEPSISRKPAPAVKRTRRAAQ
jgi:hypothetical protein